MMSFTRLAQIRSIASSPLVIELLAEVDELRGIITDTAIAEHVAERQNGVQS